MQNFERYILKLNPKKNHINVTISQSHAYNPSSLLPGVLVIFMQSGIWQWPGSCFKKNWTSNDYDGDEHKNDFKGDDEKNL